MFSTKTILLDCPAQDKDSIIQAIAEHAVKTGLVSDAKAYVASVQHREAEFSTGVGYGVAIPHGKSEAVNTAFVIYARVKNVEWNSFDGAPVDMVFQIGVPASDAGETHLRLLATLSRKLMKEEFRDAVRAANSAEAVLAVFKAYELV